MEGGDAGQATQRRKPPSRGTDAPCGDSRCLAGEDAKSLGREFLDEPGSMPPVFAAAVVLGNESLFRDMQQPAFLRVVTRHF